MPFEPEKITKQHVLNAVSKIKQDNIKLSASVIHDVIIEDEAYPPLEIMRYAHEQMNGELIWNLRAGDPTNRYLSVLGFIVKKKSELLTNTDHKRYWLYAPGENAHKWEEFYDAEIMALGWNELGDLTQYASKQEIADKLRETENSTSSKSNDAAANFEFKNMMKPGDIVIAKKGITEYLGLWNCGF